MGWDQTKWESKKFPTAVGRNLPNISKHKTEDISQEDLNQDPLLKGRPISLTRVDGHARWVSPRVLDIMDTLPADDDITGGQIIRDLNGKPTGKSLHNLYARLAQTSHRDFCRQRNGSYSITGMEWSTNGRIFRGHHQHRIEVWANKHSRCGYEIVHDLIFQKVRRNQVFYPRARLTFWQKSRRGCNSCGSSLKHRTLFFSKKNFDSCASISWVVLCCQRMAQSRKLPVTSVENGIMASLVLSITENRLGSHCGPWSYLRMVVLVCYLITARSYVFRFQVPWAHGAQRCLLHILIIQPYEVLYWKLPLF